MKAWLPLFVFLLAVGLTVSLVFPNSLNQGQRVKQFFAHSISHDLATRGLSNFARTEVPCADPVRGTATQVWVEEPPVFHSFAAILYNLGATHPAIPGFIAGLLMILSLQLILPLLFNVSPTNSALLSLVVFLVPATTRYWAQHIPDYFAACALLFFVAALFRRQRVWMLFALTVAVTAKALVIVPAFFILLGYHWESLRRDRLRVLGNRDFLFAVAVGFVAITPTLLWFWNIRVHELPNPFFLQKGLLEGRHTGSLDYLLRLDYWARFTTWNFSKGVGLALLAAILIGWRHLKIDTHERRAILSWALGIIPYWLLIRDGNYVHDYYSLPFVSGLALLGVMAAMSLPSTKLRLGLMSLSILLGLAQPFSLAKRASSVPANFCDHELTQAP
jgi:hypothetical protein